MRELNEFFRDVQREEDEGKEFQKCAKQILFDRVGVRARGAGKADSPGLKVRNVDMIGSDRHRSDEADPAPFQQLTVDPRFRANHENVSILHRTGCHLAGVEQDDIAKTFESRCDERSISIKDDSQRSPVHRMKNLGLCNQRKIVFSCNRLRMHGPPSRTVGPDSAEPRTPAIWSA